nr:hypothetical protein [Clostridia bacterium]
MANRPWLDQMEVDGVTYDLKVANATPAVEGYGGNDLSEEFANAAALHAAVNAGDFSKIHIGDYFPITLNGSFYDYSLYTVPAGTTYYSEAALTTEVATTSAAMSGAYQSATAVKIKIDSTDYYVAIGDCTLGYEKTLSNAVMKMEVAAIDPYINSGDSALSAHHILMCSRDLLPPTLQMRSANSVWCDTAATNPWLGSALYKTLNDADSTGYTGHGIIKLVEATALGPYVFKGPNNKGMRAYLMTMAAGAAAPTAGEWADRGRLFLPEEREVYGAPVRDPAPNTVAQMLYNQWPIFVGSSRHIIKGAGNGGSRTNWWLETAYSAAYFAVASGYGTAYYSYASSAFRAPLCFLLT